MTLVIWLSRQTLTSVYGDITRVKPPHLDGIAPIPKRNKILSVFKKPDVVSSRSVPFCSSSGNSSHFSKHPSLSSKPELATFVTTDVLANHLHSLTHMTQLIDNLVKQFKSLWLNIASKNPAWNGMPLSLPFTSPQLANTKSNHEEKSSMSSRVKESRDLQRENNMVWRLDLSSNSSSSSHNSNNAESIAKIYNLWNKSIQSSVSDKWNVLGDDNFEIPAVPDAFHFLRSSSSSDTFQVDDYFPSSGPLLDNRLLKRAFDALSISIRQVFYAIANRIVYVDMRVPLLEKSYLPAGMISSSSLTNLGIPDMVTTALNNLEQIVPRVDEQWKLLTEIFFLEVEAAIYWLLVFGDRSISPREAGTI